MALTRIQDNMTITNDVLTIVSSGGTTNLTSIDFKTVFVTGSSTHTIEMPDAATCYVGQSIDFYNFTGQTISLRADDTSYITDLAPTMSCRLNCVIASGVTEASWRGSEMRQLGKTLNTWTLQLAGGRVYFNTSHVNNSDANNLDDYEEGSWTPVVVGTGTAGTGTYSTQYGSYLKVGKQVTFMGFITTTAHTGTGDIQINGLPFTSSADGAVVNISSVSNLSITAGNRPVLTVTPSATTITVKQVPTGGGAQSNIPMDVAFGMGIGGTYYVP